MMKLILSSCDFRNAESREVILASLPKPVGVCRLLFIPNEKATADKIRSGRYHARMEEFGFSRENVFVFDETRAGDFCNLDLDVLYISGGNTFAILDKLRRSGFDREIVRYVRAGVTYIGGSAGAHIASRSVAHVARYDEPPAHMTDFRGLGLFDGILLCHFTPERTAHRDQLIAENACPMYTLADNESIVIG